jgi:hypothetical protein
MCALCSVKVILGILVIRCRSIVITAIIVGVGIVIITVGAY